MTRFFRNSGVNRVNRPGPPDPAEIAPPARVDLHDRAADQPPAQRDWQAHLEAGRLAAPRGASPPAIAANRARTERLVLGPRRERRW